MRDVFRKEHKQLDPQVKDDIYAIKCKAENLLHEIDTVALREKTDIRCIALAKTNLEQAVMWAIKAIT